jgi:tRNA nucleotidyltransferase (CCA-adding enzyme)
MVAKDIMTTQVMTVLPTTTIKEAITLIVEIEISGLVVLGDNSEVIGIITEKDLLVAYDLLKETKSPIKDFVNCNVVSINEDTPIEEISRILVQSNIKRVPVLKGKQAVGVVSRRDILRHILKTA